MSQTTERMHELVDRLNGYRQEYYNENAPSVCKNRKASSSDWYLCRWLFCVMPYENFVFIPVVL